MRAGYQRIRPDSHPEAVLWWYVAEFPDGFVFSRGGRCATTRKARRLIDGQMQLAEAEHMLFWNRVVATMDATGEITPVDYGPYGAEHRVLH